MKIFHVKANKLFLFILPLLLSDLAIGQRGLIVNKNSTMSHSLSWSPDGKFLANIHSGSSINITEASNSKIKTVLTRRYVKILSIAWSPNSNQIASVFKDKIIAIWDVTNKNIIRSLEFRLDKITALSWSPNGKYLACASDREIHIWNTDSWEIIRKLFPNPRGITYISWSSNSEYLISSNPYSKLNIWSIDDGKKVNRFQNIALAANIVYLSPDGKYILGGYSNGLYRIFDSQVGILLHEIQMPSKENISSISWSPSGSILAGGTNKGNVNFWHIPKGELIETIPMNSGKVISVSWSPNGEYLAIDTERGAVEIPRVYSSVSILEIELASLQSDTLEIPSMERLNDRIKEIRGPKTEFETEDMYRQRVKTSESRVKLLQSDYTTAVAEARKKYEDRQAEQKIAIKKYLPNTRKTGPVNFILGPYNPNEEYFPLNLYEARKLKPGMIISAKELFPTFSMDDQTLFLSVPIEDAREFKSHIKDVKVVATKQLNLQSKWDFFDLKAMDKITGKSYKSKGRLRKPRRGILVRN